MGTRDLLAAVIAVSTTGKGWDETLSPGQTYSRRFKKAGTFKYHCSFHSEMVGKVVVTS